ncbi:MAG: UDP-N-acetylmuramate dehydrogenase [Bacteroidales bacterium]
MNIETNASLQSYNTFGIDAKAKYLVHLDNEDSIIDYLNNHGLKKDETFIMGGGSNVLFTRDFDGVVLRVELTGIDIIDEDDDHVYVKASAGEEWDTLVQFAVEKNLGGLENLSLIPGSVGAAPVQNIGAYGVEQKDHFFSLESISIREQEKREFSKKDCHFGYRDSIFKNEYAKQYIITSVTYRLDKNPGIQTNYGAIKTELEAMDIHNPGVKDVAKAIRNIRRRKLPDPEKTGNAGSFFKNPVVSKETHDKLKEKYPDMVSFPIDENHYKLAAGWMIEYCGWKGKSVGHASVHKQQALVLVNLGKAKGNEVVHLSRMIRMSIEKEFGVKLEYEVIIL